MRKVMLTGAAIIAGVVATVAAQQAAPIDPIRELLVEVRGLRAAMERQATVGARVQLTVARIQLQEQRINELSRRAVSLRSELRNLESEATQLQTMMQQILDPSSPIPAEQRQELEHQVAMMKGQLANIEKRRVDVTQEESFVSQQLSTEQGRWSAINEQLDALERSLGR